LERRESDGRRRYRRGVAGLPRKNGKSLLGSAVGLHALTETHDAAEVYACAGDRQQGRIVFDEAKWQVQQSPALSSICKVYRDVIEVPSTGSIFRVLSADAKLQQGLNPSVVIFDELHVQPNDDLWDAMTLGSGARVDPLVLAITTAGHDLDTLLGRLYLYGQQVSRGEVEDDSFGFWWWEPAVGLAHTDPEAWRQANPNLDEGMLDREDLETAARPGQTTEFAFRRFRLNQWSRAAESWLPVGKWDECEGEPDFDPDLKVWVGVDMALKHDSIAVVAAQPQPSGKVHVQARIWQPDGTNPIDIAAVERHLRNLHVALNVVEFTYDPAYFERSAQVLVDDGLPMVEFPQSAARMVPACQTAYAMIVNGSLVHAGSPRFTDQVLSAATRQTDDGWRLSKGKSHRKIDAAIALVIAVHRSLTGTPPEPAATAAAAESGDQSLYRPTGRLTL
jgi:phage terminase large subunit-like protein